VTFDVTVGGRSVQVDVGPSRDGGYLVSIAGGPPRRIDAGRLGDAEWWVEEDGARRAVAVHLAGEVLTAQVDGHGLAGTVVDPRARSLAAIGGGHEGAVFSPMPGSIVRVLVSKGQAVHKGQILVVVEAMKMENEFRSPIDGTVAELPSLAGNTVDANALLARVEP
jgi:biotin carboxyl carrier protein